MTDLLDTTIDAVLTVLIVVFIASIIANISALAGHTLIPDNILSFTTPISILALSALAYDKSRKS